LLTCTPGAELYSVFGHNALRIIDSTAGTDIVYNYGTFDFDDPDFYTKFVRGKLLYFLSQQSFQNFKYEYEYFKRGIVEQVLNFDCNEKKKIQEKLFDNMQERNRSYKYDFLKDNCSTRLRDIIFNSASMKSDSLRMRNLTASSYRDHLHSYLDRAKMPWTTLGIDILLGIGADLKMNTYESMFLPDYLKMEVAKSMIGKKKLVFEENVIVPDLQPVPVSPKVFGQPLVIFSLLLIIILILGFSKKIFAKKLKLYIERLIYLITGLLGLLFLFTWFSTDHESFRYNINLMWAFPLNLLLFYALSKETKSFSVLFKTCSILSLLVLFVSFLFPGTLNIGLTPFIILLSYLAWIHSKNGKRTSLN